jgi:V/A-type H+/Na+-transporting ATPase subunit C
LKGGQLELTKDTDYAYAVARIKAVEKHMLDRSGLDRLLDARTSADALKLLVDAGYGYSVVEPSDLHNYEKLLEEENSKVYSLLKEVSPEAELVELFLQRNDFHNAKVIIKGEYSGQEYDSIFLEPSLINVGRLKVMIRERDTSKMPPVMRQAVEESLDVLNRTKDPQIVDILIDKAMFARMDEYCIKLGGSFLKGLVTVMIDIANLKMFMRIRKMNRTWDYLQKALIPGGTIDNDRFVNSFQEPDEKVIEEFKYTRYGQIFEEGVERLRHTGSFAEFERLCDNYLIGYIKKHRYVSLGPEPVVAYLVFKENEIRNIRIIMTGKINNIPDDVIRGRLRESYV